MAAYHSVQVLGSEEHRAAAAAVGAKAAGGDVVADGGGGAVVEVGCRLGGGEVGGPRQAGLVSGSTFERGHGDPPIGVMGRKVSAHALRSEPTR
jgi:hypothetical protein